MNTLASSTKEFLVKYRAMLLLLFLSFLVTGFIPNKALAAEDNVKSITVPKSVTKIGPDAFRSIGAVIYEE
jgi:hypothetical protein